MRQNILNRSCVDKSRHAQTLPKNGAQHAQKVELARKWLDDFDAHTIAVHNTARENAHILERLLQQEAPHALLLAQEVGLLNAFPFPATDAGSPTPLALMNARVDVLALYLESTISSGDVEVLFPLLRYLALRLLHTEHTVFAAFWREAAWFSRSDTKAVDNTPYYYHLFESYLDHSGRRAEFEATGLLIADVVADGDPIERTPAYFVKVWEEELVRLYDEKSDRLSVVTRTLPQHARPDISDEEIEADRTLGLVVRHWEREHAPTWNALQSEKAQLEAWLATEGLEKAYWWARGVDQGLTVGRGDDCDPIKPTFALLIYYWREKGIAGDDITVDALFDAYFKDEEDG